MLVSYGSNHLLCADCAPLTGMGTLYLFSPFLPVMLYVLYSLTHKEMEAHRD